MMKWLKYINIALLFLLCEPASAQSDRNFIRSGNKLYRQQNYAKAEIEYRKALAKNPSNPQAMYNLGCALLMQQKDSAAIEQLQNIYNGCEIVPVEVDGVVKKGGALNCISWNLKE